MKFIAVILGLFTLGSIVSCRVQTAPPEYADVTGLVWLDSGMFTPTPSGVTVSLEGTNFSALTDDSGRFELNNVPSGTYTVRWSKPGYGDVRYIGAAIQGGGNSPVYIAQPVYDQWPSQNITTYLHAFSHVAANVQSASFSASTYNGTCLILDGSYTDDEYLQPDHIDFITAFFSHKQDVSPIEGHYDGYYSESGNISELDGTNGYVFDTTNNTFHYVLAEGSLMQSNFHSGDSLYIAVYGTVAGVGYPGDYYDPTYNEEVITSYNQTPSPVIGLKIP